MSDRVKSNIPFVGLHAHSVAGSLFDALGYPNEHMDFAYNNGCDALALTDHGNANGLSHQLLHAKEKRVEILSPSSARKHILFRPSKSGVKSMRKPWRTKNVLKLLDQP